MHASGHDELTCADFSVANTIMAVSCYVLYQCLGDGLDPQSLWIMLLVFRKYWMRKSLRAQL